MRETHGICDIHVYNRLRNCEFKYRTFSYWHSCNFVSLIQHFHHFIYAL